MNTKERRSNYEFMKCQMQKEFLKYDQDSMVRKFHLNYDAEYIYMTFLSRIYRIGRNDGIVWWSEDNFVNVTEAGYNEAMTIYDVLCYSRENCGPSGEFVNMKSLSAIQGGSMAVGTGFVGKIEKLFDHNDEALSRACERLNGTRSGKGDVAYQIPIFDFLMCRIQFWNSDEEFQPSLQIFVDKHILEYMHYETMWLAVSHLMSRLQEQM